MTFFGGWVFELAYGCGLTTPIPPVDGPDQTHIFIEQGATPGELFPQGFVLRSFEFEPGDLYVYQNENNDRTAFFNGGP